MPTRSETTKSGQRRKASSQSRTGVATLTWLIAQLESEDIESEFYDAKVSVLREYVQHHVKEEEKEIFAKVRQSDLDTKALRQVLQDEKQNLQAGSTRH